MFSIEDQLVQLYVFVDDFCQTRPDLADWRHSPHQHPAFSDAEVLTIALLQSGLEVASLKQTYRLIAANHRTAFPCLCSYSQWIARVHALTTLLQALLRATTNLAPETASFYLIDAKPIPVCLIRCATGVCACCAKRAPIGEKPVRAGFSDSSS